MANPVCLPMEPNTGWEITSVTVAYKQADVRPGRCAGFQKILQCLTVSCPLGSEVSGLGSVSIAEFGPEIQCIDWLLWSI